MIIRIFLTLLFVICGVSASGCDSCFVRISIPVACMRDGQSHASQLISQAVLGTPMQVVDKGDGEWWKLKGPDGYEGYVIANSFVELEPDSLYAWKKSDRLRVSSLREATVYVSPGDNSPRNIVTSLVNGSVVNGEYNPKSEYLKIILPDGRKGYIRTQDVVPLDSSAPIDFDKLVDFCYAYMGSPYLWGGNSTKSMDCSGLVRVAFGDQGILLPRDAKDQYNVGEPVEIGDLRRGDLMFFSSSPDGGINHVAIYDGEDRYIHCSGMVKTSLMKPDDPDFSTRCYRGARRISETSESVVLLSRHPWYFLQNK